MWNRVGVCRCRCFFALALTRPNRLSPRSLRLPKSAEYSVHDVQQMLDEEESKGFKTDIPEGCNCVIVTMPKAVMRAYRQREQAWLKRLRNER